MADLLDAISDAREVVKTISSVDDRIRLSEALDRASALRDENERLKRKVRKLRKKLAAMKKLETYKGASYVIEDDGEKTGPICPWCYKHDGITVLLARSNGGARCQVCKRLYAGVSTPVEGYRMRAC